MRGGHETGRFNYWTFIKTRKSFLIQPDSVRIKEIFLPFTHFFAIFKVIKKIESKKTIEPAARIEKDTSTSSTVTCEVGRLLGVCKPLNCFLKN